MHSGEIAEWALASGVGAGAEHLAAEFGGVGVGGDAQARALEVRVPLLDHVFVEYIASLPGNWKLKGLTTKHVLRSGLKGLLPDNIVYRGKQGYSLPVKQLLREDLKDYMLTLLNESPVIAENMHRPYIDRLIDQHIRGSHNHNHILWAMMNVAIWHNRFFV